MNAQFQKAELRDAPIPDRKRTQRSQREELGFARNDRSQPRNLFGVPALAGSGRNSKLSLPQKSAKDAKDLFHKFGLIGVIRVEAVLCFSGRILTASPIVP
jgi:hypothetical protein